MSSLLITAINGVYYVSKVVDLCTTGVSLVDKCDKVCKGETLTTSDKVQGLVEVVCLGVGATAMVGEARCAWQQGSLTGVSASIKTMELTGELSDQLEALYKQRTQLQASIKAIQIAQKTLMPTVGILHGVSQAVPLVAKGPFSTQESTQAFLTITLNILCEAALLQNNLAKTPTPLTAEQTKKAQKSFEKCRSMIASSKCASYLGSALKWALKRLIAPQAAGAAGPAAQAPPPGPVAPEAVQAPPQNHLAALLAGMEQDEREAVRAIINALTPESIAALLEAFDQEIPDEFRNVDIFSTFIDPISTRPIRFPVNFEDRPTLYERASLEKWIADHPGGQVPGDDRPGGRTIDEIRDNLPLRGVISRKCEEIKTGLRAMADLMTQAEAV